MSAFSEAAFEKKLSELSNSQQSVQTLSLWLIHHRKHARTIAKVWHGSLKKTKPSRKLTYLYLANDVIQNSKRKGPELTREFSSVLLDAFSHVAREADDRCRTPMQRLLHIWQERAVYDGDFIEQLLQAASERKTKKRTRELTVPVQPTRRRREADEEEEENDEEDEEKKVVVLPAAVMEDDHYLGNASPKEPPEAGELVRVLTELESAASSDAAVRQKIASLPPAVQDISQLSRITDREAAERLTLLVDEACLLLADYNGRLAAELEDRRQLARMLADYTRRQQEQLREKERRLEEYKQKLSRVTWVRRELKAHIQSLPDLSQLPNVTGGLAPLPSAGDLFSL
ncbi:regulation of nuclear pre-mRNA domain-containing protein 1B-like isoform X2 [Petromyzon marinus]|uniref:Regulation of nuclear pre-mRNA domain-containing protein 1B-like isoform X2 n=1 Tax=Petromyzon marinus TaxID=7757 RepID=A0AAJ7TZD2_PETMA|nr:regulation of nuclear pre-mRNA domain-containing protein 1B-like isoform X2 [Petromyzon marinus]